MATPLWPARVKIWLNEGEDNFLGFRNTFANRPRLRLAAEFELTQQDCTERVGYTTRQVPTLALIYEQLNVGGDVVPATDWTTNYRAARNRSLSVGDVVQIGDKFYACQTFGWAEVDAFEVDEAIADYDTYGPYLRPSAAL